MTEEEKAIKALCVKCSSYDFCVKGNQLHCAETVAYIKGLAEGEKMGFDKGYKKATERAYERQKDLTETYIKDGEKIKQLEKENAELKKDKEYLDKVNNEQTEVILKLNEQIEKMENCWNCKFFKEKKYQACIDYKKNNTKCCAFYKWELAE